MADALDSKSSAFTGVRVQLPPPAPARKIVLSALFYGIFPNLNTGFTSHGECHRD